MADFLDIVAKQYVPSGEANRDRKGYTKSVIGADGQPKDITVAAGKIAYTPDASPRAQTVILKTGAKAKKTNIAFLIKMRYNNSSE